MSGPDIWRNSIQDIPGKVASGTSSSKREYKSKKKETQSPSPMIS